MNILNKIIGKTIGRCIDDGHKMEFKDWYFSYRSVDDRLVYKISFKCQRCGYTVKKYSTKAQEAAIEVLNDEYKNAKEVH